MKSRKKVPLNDSAPLSNNPFSAFYGSVENSASPEEVEDLEARKSTVVKPYSVEKTRKGGWPLSLEKRRGKTVTVLDRVSGDGTLFLKELRKKCSAGGSYADGRIEIQGDHIKIISTMLDEL